METVREFACTKKGRNDRSIFHLKESSIMTNQLNLPRIGRFGALPSIERNAPGKDCQAEKRVDESLDRYMPELRFSLKKMARIHVTLKCTNFYLRGYLSKLYKI